MCPARERSRMLRRFEPRHTGPCSDTPRSSGPRCVWRSQMARTAAAWSRNSQFGFEQINPAMAHIETLTEILPIDEVSQRDVEILPHQRKVHGQHRVGGGRSRIAQLEDGEAGAS